MQATPHYHAPEPGGHPFVQQGLGAGLYVAPLRGRAGRKEQLANILHGTLENGPSAVLFTGSHGLEWSTDADGQRQHQGALVTQEVDPARPPNLNLLQCRRSWR